MYTMFIAIKQASLSESPLNDKNKASFMFDSELLKVVNDLKSLFDKENARCILISGYRGSGKTSLINKLKSFLSQDNTDFLIVCLDIPKHISHDLLLKTLIRKLYVSIHENEKIRGKIDEKLFSNLELLYSKTFFEIKQAYKIADNSEKRKSISFRWSISNIFLMLVTLVSFIMPYTTTYSPILENINNILQKIYIPLVFIILFIFKNMNFFIALTSSKIKNSELNIYELYDDDIAEYHLKNILSELRKKIGIIIVLDELDKIDKSEDIDALITEIKPLMLSGVASFVLVSGQKLCYKLEKSYIEEDPLISSIFSRFIHVPLLSVDSFRNLFNKLTDEGEILTDKGEILTDKGEKSKKMKNELKEQLSEGLFYSIILASKRIPRHFINLILQNLRWIDSKCVLDPKVFDESTYKIDKTIVEILNDVEEKNIKFKKYPEPIKDFLIYQMYKWANIIKIEKSVFYSENIIKGSKEDCNQAYLDTLPKLCLSILDNMVKENLLEKIITEKKIPGYKWIAPIKFEQILTNKSQIILDSKFLDNMEIFKRKIINCYLSLPQNSLGNNLLPSFDYILNDLISNGIIEEENKSIILYANSLFEIISKREKIEINEYDKIREIEKIIYGISTKLVENYVTLIAKKYFSRKKFKCKRDNTNKSAYIFSSERIRIRLNVLDYDSYIDTKDKYRKFHGQTNYHLSWVNYLYTNLNAIDIEREKEKYSALVRNGISIYLISNFDEPIGTGIIEKSLDEVVKGRSGIKLLKPSSGISY